MENQALGAMAELSLLRLLDPAPVLLLLLLKLRLVLELDGDKDEGELFWTIVLLELDE